MDNTRGLVVGVLGASGGLGASTLAAGLARCWSASSPVALVDGSVGMGGLDVTACAEHAAGLRWDDLAEARGGFDGRRLSAALPRAGDGVRVLSSSGRAVGPRPAPEVIEEAVEALASVHERTVLDLPRGRGLVAGGDLVGECDVVVVLAGVSVRGVCDAVAVVGALPERLRVASCVVTRARKAGDPLHAQVAEHLGLALLRPWPDEARVRREAARGQPPGDSRHVRLIAAELDGWLAQQEPRAEALAPSEALAARPALGESA
ncbi:MAG: hypothetical protein LWW86_11790 [Micrococcales bacterium]|nr:hypothetical protein [Micrococcales bacterium]